MFKNLKDLINTRQKLEDARHELLNCNKAIDHKSEMMQNLDLEILQKKEQLSSELARKEIQIKKIEIIIADRRETLKGLNRKINPGLSTPKKAAPKKAVKKN